MTPNSKEILKSAEAVLENDGEKLSNNERSFDELLQNMENSKDTLSGLKIEKPNRGGILGRLKNWFEVKVTNIVLNIIERQVEKQQKFNESVYEVVKRMGKENAV